jgi:hypothetical protein
MDEEDQFIVEKNMEWGWLVVSIEQTLEEACRVASIQLQFFADRVRIIQNGIVVIEDTG